MRKLTIKPGLILGIFIGIYLIIGIVIVEDYGFSTDQSIETKRAAIALKKYGVDIDMGYFPYDYDDIGHSQFYGTATTMLLLWADSLLGPGLNLQPGVVMHYGYFLTFVFAIIALYFLAKLFFDPWIALFAALLFATQPLLFGHAFMNSKDIPMLSVFLLTVTAGFYIDRHLRWQESLNAKINRSKLLPSWRQYLSSLPRSTFGVFGFIIAVILGIAILTPLLTNWLTQIITTAYIDPVSFWGSILQHMANNFQATPLDAYINKGVTNLNRLLNLTTAILLFGLLIYAVIIFRKGFRQLPKDLQSQSVLHSISIHLKNPILIVAALIYGFAISTRIIALFAGGMVIFYLLWTYWKKAFIPLVIYTFFTGLTAYIFWPVFWRYGFATLPKALMLFSDFDPYIGFIHFNGQIIREYEIPWNYLPQLISIQYTIPVIILCVLGFVLWIVSSLLDRKWSGQKMKLLLIFLWFALPLAYVVITTPILYNNARQFIFITPPLFIFAAFTVHFLHERLRKRFVLPIVAVLALAPGVLSLFSLHPYQYIYMNQFVGGVGNAFRDYDTDYTYLAMKEGIEYINNIAPEQAQILIWDVEYPQTLMYIRPDITIGRVALVDEGDYHTYQYAVIPTIRNADLLIPDSWTRIHSISRDGADLAVIYEIKGKQ